MIADRYLRGDLDSSPLWGAAKVEDTYNLLEHALRKALDVIARMQQRELAAVAAEANAEILAASSLKAALDLDWDEPEAKAQALSSILQALERVEALLPKLTHRLDDQKNIAFAYWRLGRIYQAWGKYKEAIAHHEQSRDLYATLDLQQKVAYQLSWLADCYRESKEHRFSNRRGNLLTFAPAVVAPIGFGAGTVALPLRKIFVLTISEPAF